MSIKKLTEELKQLLYEVTYTDEFKYKMLPENTTGKQIHDMFPEVVVTTTVKLTIDDAKDYIEYFGKPGKLYAVRIGYHGEWLIGGFLGLDESLNEEEDEKDNFSDTSSDVDLDIEDNSSENLDESKYYVYNPKEEEEEKRLKGSDIEIYRGPYSREDLINMFIGTLNWPTRDAQAFCNSLRDAINKMPDEWIAEFLRVQNDEVVEPA